MKMAGVKSKKEFYAKYPTEQSFLEAFPQAVKMFPQMAQGGATDEIAFPQAPVTGAFFNYGHPTMNIPRLFQDGGATEDAMEEVINAVAQQLQIDPNQIMAMLQQNPEAMAQLEQLVAQDPNQAVQALAQMVEQSMGGQVPQEGQGMSPEEQAMMEQQAMEGQGMEMPPMMAYGGNPFVDSPLDRFVNGGSMLREYAEGGDNPCGEGYIATKLADGSIKCDPAPQKPITNLEQYTGLSPVEGLGYLLAGAASSRIPFGRNMFKTFVKENPKFVRNIGLVSSKGKVPAAETPSIGVQALRSTALPGTYSVGKHLLSPAEQQVSLTPFVIPPAERDASRTTTAEPPVYKLNKQAYGGGMSVNPFNYGAYAPPMAYGGSNAPMGDTDYTPVSSERLDALMRFVQGGMQRAQQEEMTNYMMGIEPNETMRRGGSKKKKG
jgi:hypothetical protein